MRQSKQSRLYQSVATFGLHLSTTIKILNIKLNIAVANCANNNITTLGVFTLVVQFSWSLWSGPKKKMIFSPASHSIHTDNFNNEPKDTKQQQQQNKNAFYDVHFQRMVIQNNAVF